MSWPPGLIRFDGTMPPGNGWPVSGSIGSCSEQPGRPGPLKSPRRSASLGTKDVLTSLRLSLFHSCETKKWSLSFRIGPPTV